MATYKAEFRAHYYAGRLRPRAAYSMGLIHRWARIASHVPCARQCVCSRRLGSATAAKWVGGIAPRRSMPRFADVSFTDWFRNQPRQAGKRGRVMLWPDTFNNYFRPGRRTPRRMCCEKLGYRGGRSPTARCAAGARSMTGACSMPQRSLADRRSPLSRRKSRPARRSSASSRPVSAPSATSLPGLFPDDRRRAVSAARLCS